jgi:hypothetical protein
MPYEASCHCGAVALIVDADLPIGAMSCNCSHCQRKGLLLAPVPRDKVTITRGEDQLKTYQFYKHVIDHRFCAECGVQPLATGKGKDGAEMAMINLRAVPAVDLDGLQIQKVDGASK